MHKSAIKTFATEARTQLRAQMQQRAAAFGLTAKALSAPEQLTADRLIMAGKVYGSEEAQGYKGMVERFERLKKQHRTHSAAYEALIDEAAYSWFNRLCALRFMEVHGFLPYRVLSSTLPEGDPELLKESLRLALEGSLPGIDAALVDSLRYTDDAALYRKLLVAQCNALKGDYPFLFEQISEELALLLPNNLLSPESVVGKLITQIPEADWQDVEIIGWLYQYYISDRKDAVIGAKSKVATVDIPAATQLFTPAWIVQYMVQNSLGRLWLEHYPDSPLREQMPYYLDSPPQDEAVQLKIEAAIAQHKSDGPLSPEAIRVIDPACGSGHILVYAFDLLFAMYREQGYRDRDIAPLILTHNLTGLDLDARAVQLASFALLMKARQTLRRLKGLQPNVLLVHSSKGIDLDTAVTANALSAAEIAPWQGLVEAFHDADALGSLITPPPLDYAALQAQLTQWQDSPHFFVQGLAQELQPILAQAQALATQYDVVVANPPYMGAKSFNPVLKSFVAKHYPRSKSDLFAVFMERIMEMTCAHRYASMVVMQSWMFLSSYEELRKHLTQDYTIENLLHMGNNVMKIAFGTSAVTFKKTVLPEYRGAYTWFEVDNLDAQQLRPSTFPALNERNQQAEGYVFQAVAEEFTKIPGAPVAYWVSEQVRKIFQENKLLENLAITRRGLQTGCSPQFIRFWSECSIEDSSLLAISESKYKWFPLNSGGSYRKWYGNVNEVVNWEANGIDIKSHPKAIIPNESYYFKPGITWPKVSSGKCSFRYLPDNYIPGDAGPSMFILEQELSEEYLLSFLNSKVNITFLLILAPTLNFEVGTLSKLPVRVLNKVDVGIQQAISLSKTDWDAFETSWDFEVHPIVRYAQQAEADTTVQASFDQWQTEAEERFRELQRLEIENNRFWIEAYGLQDELDPDVPDEQVTVSRADLARDVVSLLSYAVGCLMGRYSLDQKGLVHAGQPFDASKHTTFAADADAIVPVHEVGWFEDDLVLQLMQWLKTVFGTTHYAENLRFVAEVLGQRKGETPEDALRRYFLSGFMKDHHKLYKKRPIYWFFTSGKQRAFNAYMYLHRYDKDTLARLRTDYLHPLQLKLQGEYERLEGDSGQARRLKQLQDQLKELQAYDEVLKHKADQRIALDLDDGVAYNYTLFEGLVYEGSDLKMKDLFSKSQWKRDLLAEAEKAEI